MNISLGYLYFLIICFIYIGRINALFFDWLWPSDEVKKKEINSGVPLIAIPFEYKAEDEKFLEEATKFTDIIKSSALDSCQHKIVLKIKKSCSSMTEEELAKMSVNLLNCQSEVDGRQTFPCTESMNLKECTVKMDATMWNAYHMMNNRARAVCLASRRAQFQALSEMTVNKLMSAAHEQINKMNVMVDNQNRLEELTLGTINVMEKGNIKLLKQQDELKKSQIGINNFMSHNMLELIKEKALIAAGHKELAKMTQSIKEKLDEANSQLHIQSEERYEHHQKLLADIEDIQKQTKEIFQKIDASTNKLLFHHAEVASKYQETVDNLMKISETVHYLLKSINTIRFDIQEKFNLMQSFLGTTGMQVERIFTVVCHIAYLLLGMLFASFLNLSTISRAILFVIVSLNLFASYYQQSDLALDFFHMTVLLLISVLTIAVSTKLLKFSSSPSLPEYPSLNRASQKEEFNSCFYNKYHNFQLFFKQCISYLNSYLSSAYHSSSKSVDFSQRSIHSENHIRDSVIYHRNEEDDFNSSPLNLATEVSSDRLVREWLENKIDNPLSISSASSNSQKICTAICRSSRRRCRNVSSRGSEFCFKHLEFN